MDVPTRPFPGGHSVVAGRVVGDARGAVHPGLVRSSGMVQRRFDPVASRIACLYSAVNVRRFGWPCGIAQREKLQVSTHQAGFPHPTAFGMSET